MVFGGWVACWHSRAASASAGGKLSKHIAVKGKRSARKKFGGRAIFCKRL